MKEVLAKEANVSHKFEHMIDGMAKHAAGGHVHHSEHYKKHAAGHKVHHEHVKATHNK